MSSLLLLSLLTPTSLSDHHNWVYEATAEFTEYAEGSVTIINGHVMVDLDISEAVSHEGSDDMNVPEDCFDNGLYMHVHTQWNQDTDSDYLGSVDCNPGDQTGDHFDPWFACSPKTDAEDCDYNGGCIPPSRYKIVFCYDICVI